MEKLLVKSIDETHNELQKSKGPWKKLKLSRKQRKRAEELSKWKVAYKLYKEQSDKWKKDNKVSTQTVWSDTGKELTDKEHKKFRRGKFIPRI